MIIVFGSINMDHNLQVRRFPKAGETVLSSSYTLLPGGKGANQSFAAARLGAKTAIVGIVGDDGMGLRVLNHLKRNEVMTSGVATSEDLPTGMASVIKNSKEENQIIVVSGANVQINAEQAPVDIFNENNILLVQIEVPIEQTKRVIKNAKAKGAKIILNLAPVAEISKDILQDVDYLIVNSIEARQLGQGLGVDIDTKAEKLAAIFAKQGDLTCIITRGPKGVVAVQADGTGWTLPSVDLGEHVRDTTGAGDCFCGTFAACLHEKKLFSEALRVSIVASGLSCMGEGTQESYPYLADIEQKLESFPKVKKIAV
jgi:ribokinase